MMVGLLLRDDLSSDCGFSIIPIKGMGSLRKTTLAQLVFNDSENYDVWTNLCKPFKAGLPGSKIIVTTRNKGVSSMVTTPNAAYSLGNLLTDDCLHIFVQHSLGRTYFSAHQYLSKICEKIVDRCNDSPLAAKTLGVLFVKKKKK
ncbi:hypothetical protein WN943_016225 [Citrus x changshan-huyou]